MELKRDEIIKALECCVTPRDNDCDNCPLDKSGSVNCKWLLSSLALDVIKELTEKNERLNKSYTNLVPTLNEVRADTVRKMQTEIEARCIKGGIYPAFVKSTIDQIAKELIGE